MPRGRRPLFVYGLGALWLAAAATLIVALVVIVAVVLSGTIGR